MTEPINPTTKTTLKSMLNYQWIVMNISFFLFLALIAILYIANGHLTDKTIRKINTTQRELKELQFEYKTLKADLMRRSRAVEIQDKVAPYGLVLAKEMPVRLVQENKIQNHAQDISKENIQK